MASGPRVVVAGADRALAYARSTLPGRCLLRFRHIDGRDRTLAIAGQAFTTLVPLLIVTAALASDAEVALLLIERFGLTGTAATAVHLLFSRPPGATGTITVLGIVVLFYSGLSFTRALQRTWEAAWELPRAGVRGTLHAATGLALLVAQLIALALLANAFSGWPGAGAVGFGVRLMVATGLWLELQRLLLSGRVSRAELLPGAVVAGLGQVAASIYSALWMPHLIATNASRYGVVGVTFALLTWLIVISFGVVAAAVVSAEVRVHRRAAQAPAGPRADPGEEPAPRGRRERLAALAHRDRGDHFGVVLLLVATTVGCTAAAPPTWWARTMVVGLQTVTLLAALRAALAGTRIIVATAVVWSAGVLSALAVAATGGDADGITAGLGVALLAATLGCVLRRLGRQPVISPSTVAGAISAYLLLGLLFTYLYDLLAALGPPPLSGTQPQDRLNEYLYFAFTTLTTTGYGDLSPVTDVARAVAVLEALLGQLYLVTVLALAVGNMRPRRER